MLLGDALLNLLCRVIYLSVVGSVICYAFQRSYLTKIGGRNIQENVNKIMKTCITYWCACDCEYGL